jgi:hypothetical protein
MGTGEAVATIFRRIAEGIAAVAMTVRNGTSLARSPLDKEGDQ